MKKILVILLFTILIAGCATQQTTTNPDIIKVGFIGPLTGDVAKIGIPISKGIQLAANELSNIEVILEDGGCNGKDALTAYKKLTQVDKVSAIITVCSPELLAIAPEAEQDHILVISPSATAPSITNAGDHVFRLAPSDALQGEVAADLILEEGYESVGVIYVNHDYGAGLNEVLEDELGSIVVASESFEQESSDMRTQLTKLKSKNIDVLYVVGFPKDAALILKQKIELGINVPVIMAEAAKDTEILAYADESVTITVPLAEGDSYESFKVKYTAKFGEAPKIYSGEAYDTMNVVGLAAQANPQDLIAGMEMVPEYDGAAGYITFDQDGDISKPYSLFTVENHKFVTLN